MEFKRGDIYWVAFPQRQPKGAEMEKARPCVVLSYARASVFRKTLVVVPLTLGSRDAPPVIVSLPSAGAGSKAVCDQIAAVDKRRVGNRIGSLAADEFELLEECLRKVLGL